MPEAPTCHWCSGPHDEMRCPRVKAFTFGWFGRLRRVEFMTPVDNGVRIRDVDVRPADDYPKLGERRAKQ
jgi:hypothetical protein